MVGSQQTLFSLVSFESFAPHFSVQKKKRKKSIWLYRKDPKFVIFLASVPFLHIWQSYKEIDNVVNLLLHTLSK
jgi:hypothetical protein